MNQKFFLAALIVAIVFGASSDLFGQRRTKKKKNDAATVRGRIVQNIDPDLRLPYNDLNLRMVEQVKLPLPNTPNEYDGWDLEKKKKWVEAYEASEPGKKLMEERKRINDSAQSFDIKIEKNGKFVVYDVPPGRYGMHGRADKKIENKKYAFEVFGQVDVEKEVDELDLDRIMISATRLITRGEQVPEILLETFDGKAKLKNRHLKKKYVLIHFWAKSSPPSIEFLPTLKAMYTKIGGRENFELLSVNMDEDRKAALAYVKENKIRGWHGYAGDWEHKTVTEFGVRAIPSIFLIGPDSKILMTNVEFLRAFRSGKDDLAQIIDDRISGRDAPDVKVPTEKK